MSKFSKGTYIPKNPQKYVGSSPITYRSSWEHSLMQVFDNHPSVLSWASESISVPYQNPLTKKWSMYIPDFIVVYSTKGGATRCEMIEVKPEKEDPRYKGKVSKRTKLVQMINFAKWQAASAFCAKNKITFRVVTEKDMFS